VETQPNEVQRARFEEVALPHLDAAYNLARWLTGNIHDAEDVVQEAYLRALRFFGGYHGGDSRAWLLTIVRNAAYTWLRRNRIVDLTAEFDEQIHTSEETSASPEALVLEQADQKMLSSALAELPVNFREVLVLRELEGLSYKEIADVVGIPIGTVMSGLARARKRLRETLTQQAAERHVNVRRES
jgi:RNA polymerase sigma-70 factor (ECF subfamily)